MVCFASVYSFPFIMTIYITWLNQKDKREGDLPLVLWQTGYKILEVSVRQLLRLLSITLAKI